MWNYQIRWLAFPSLQMLLLCPQIFLRGRRLRPREVEKLVQALTAVNCQAGIWTTAVCPSTPAFTVLLCPALLCGLRDPPGEEQFTDTYVPPLRRKSKRLCGTVLSPFFCLLSVLLLRVPGVGRNLVRKCGIVRTGPVEVMQGLGTWVSRWRGKSWVPEGPQVLQSHLLQPERENGRKPQGAACVPPVA